MAGKAKEEKKSPDKEKAEAVAKAHEKAHGKQERAKDLLAGRELKKLSTNGVKLMAEELDIPGWDTNTRAVNEVAIRTILGVEAEGKPE